MGRKDQFKGKNPPSEAPPNFDPHKQMNKINNNKEISTPSFKLMTSRPSSSKTVLPTYMHV